MKKITLLAICIAAGTTFVSAQHINFRGGVKNVEIKTETTVTSAPQLTDAQYEDYVKEFLSYCDFKNNVASIVSAPYGERLYKLTKPVFNVDGINVKVYQGGMTQKDPVFDGLTIFASPEGSIRIFSPLMDDKSDAELLDFIAVQIGLVKNGDAERAYRDALSVPGAYAGGRGNDLTSDQRDAVNKAYLGTVYTPEQLSAAAATGKEFLKAHGIN